MALTSIVGDCIFKHVWGKFPVYCYGSIDKGALIGRDTSNDGFIEADQGDSVAACAIAMEDGANGDTIWACLAAEMADIGDAAIAASGDVCSALYLDEDGDVSLSSGATYAQQVGFVASTKSLILVPTVSLSGTALTLSGNLSVGGTLGATGATSLASTLEVTGASTLTGAVALNGGATVASGKNLTLTKGTLTSTEGDVTLTKGDLTLTEGNLAMTAGDATLTAGDLTLTDGDIAMTAGMIKPAVLDAANSALTVATDYNVICAELTDDRTFTLPTAAAGLWYEIVHKSGDKTLTIAANTSDKIIDPTDGGVHDKLADDKGLDCHIKLVAIDDTNWICTSVNGDWTGADNG